MSENNVKKNYAPRDIVIAILVLPLPLLMMQLLAYALAAMVLAIVLGLLALAVFAVVLLIGGITMFGIGISKIFSMPMGAIAIAGYGLANIGVALFTECIVFWIFTVAVPAGFRKLCRNREVKNEETS